MRIRKLLLRRLIITSLLLYGIRTVANAILKKKTFNRSGVAKFAGNTSLVRIGEFKWSRKRIIAETKIFREVYGQRPVPYSESGSNLFHAFAQWCIIKMIQPPLIVESGAMLGWGTWFLRQAAGANAHIVVISPNCPNVVANGGVKNKPFYMDTINSSYFCGNDFNDFSEIDWLNITAANDLIDLSNSLVYFDDHQSGYRRLIEAQLAGFGHLLFDDGYPWPGDNYSLKQALDVEDDLYTVKMDLGEHEKLQRKRMPYQDDFDSFTIHIDFDLKKCINSDIRDRVKVYYEFPPLWEGPWRGKMYKHMHAAREQGLLNEKEAKKFVDDFEFFKPNKNHESSAYTFITYVALRKNKFLDRDCFFAHSNVPTRYRPR